MILRKAVLSLLLAAVTAAVLIPNPASAERRDRYDRHDRNDRHEWRGRHDIRQFHRHDYGVWRGGRWHHGYHDGRLGWWWVVGSLWYLYPAPVYPYPDPYVPPGRYYYYCVPRGGYYPYVHACPPGGWRLVPDR